MAFYEILAAWLMADFLSGVFHWREDRYGVEDWPIIGPLVVSPNIEHHSQPTAFLQGNLITRNWTTFVPCWLIAAVMWLLGSPWWTLAFFFAGFGNEIHAWAHQKCSRPIRGLQMLGIIQSQEQHASHHKKPFDRNYCVMTDWVNPVLTAIGFWPAVEEVVWWVADVEPRAEREAA
jgi:ubiquitin-conjugating enzyme E2 variant